LHDDAIEATRRTWLKGAGALAAAAVLAPARCARGRACASAS